MIISFVGSQSGMTVFQREELGKLLLLKECSEFLFSDLFGAPTQAFDVAVENNISIFSIYPVQDNRKRTFTQDSKKLTGYNNITTPYFDRIFLGKSIKVRWHKGQTYTDVHNAMIKDSGLMIACPKEFKFSVRSAVWKVIKEVWRLKQDDRLIIIPPIERSNEDTSRSNTSSGIPEESKKE